MTELLKKVNTLNWQLAGTNRDEQDLWMYVACQGGRKAARIWKADLLTKANKARH